MKRVLILVVASLMVCIARSQDFVTLFMDGHKNDTLINCVTIGPRMMQKILKDKTEKDESVLEIISGLKSMQIVVSEVDGEYYYQSALETLGQNSGRYEPYVSFNSDTGDYQILVRKRNDEIVEMIMMGLEDNTFVVINFTGKIKAEFISTLAGSIVREKL